MSILKLKNCFIVTILLGVSSGYCADNADNEDRDSFALPALSRSNRAIRLEEARPEEGSEAVQYRRLLEKYTAQEQHRKLAHQHWRQNISEGIRDLQRAESAAREDSHEASVISPHSTAEHLMLLAEYAESTHRGKLARQRWRQNISEGMSAFYSQVCAADAEHPSLGVDLQDEIGDEDRSGLITPASFIGYQDIAPLGSISDSDTDDRESPRSCTHSPVALPQTGSATSSDSSSDSSRSSQSSSPMPSEHSDSEYVSDSEDDEPKQRGVIGTIFHTLFGW